MDKFANRVIAVGLFILVLLLLKVSIDQVKSSVTVLRVNVSTLKLKQKGGDDESCLAK